MENFGRRLLTLIVCFTMVLGSLNLQVFAYEDEKNSNSLSFVCEEYTEPAIGVNIPEQLKILSDDEKINLNDADVIVQWLKNIETGWMVTEESDFTEGEYRLSVNVVDLKVDPENEQIEKQTVTVNGEEFEYISEDDWSFIDGKASFTVYSKIYKVVSDSVDAEDEIELESISAVAGQIIPLADDSSSDKIYYEIAEENGENVLHLSSTPYDIERIYISKNNSSNDTPSFAEKETCTKIVIDDEIFAPVNCYSFFGTGFNNVTEIVNLNNLNTSKTTFMEFMFQNMEKVVSLDLSGFDFSNVTSTRYMFSNCKALKTITELENKDARKFENMEKMFSNCSSLESIDLSGFQTEALTNIQAVFSNCSKLTRVKLGGDFDTSNVKNMSYLFQNCTSLTDVNAEELNTESVEDMSLMFYGCGKLEKLDVSKFDTSNVKGFSGMFSGCIRLKSIDTSKFDTKKATQMAAMFFDCKSLASVDVSSFETGNVTNMASMFYGCSSMVELDVSNFDTSNVTNMFRMFGVYNGTMKLQQLDLSNFDTSKVTNMSEMFLCSTSLQYLDISNFTINDGTNVANFFYKCDNLSKIESPLTVGENIIINLPTVMVNEDDRTQLFSILPKEPDYSGSITLITYGTSILTEGSESTLLFKKYLDDELINEAGKFEFGVFEEDGTDTGIRVSHDALGNILVETKDLPLGRYYVQEIVGKESVIYDNVKYYFTIEEETVSTNIVYPSSEVVYLPIDEDYLNTDKYDLVANGFTVIAYEKGTNNPVKSMRAYCANKTRRATYGPVGTTTNSVYINPTEGQIKDARGVDYNGPHKGELPDAIKSLLFFGDEVIMQDEVWNLLHYGKEVDTSKVNEIPASFKWAIIKSPNNITQSLIVPLWTTEDKEVFDTIEGDSITKRTVKLETTDIDFRNETKPSVTLEIPLTKTVETNGVNPGQQNFEFDVVPYGNPDLDISDLTISGTTITTNGDGEYKVVITINGAKDLIEAAGGFKIVEKNTNANGWTFDDTEYVVKTETDENGNVTYKLYKLTNGAAESVTDDKTYTADHYGSQGNNHCLTIDEKVAYCFNLEREWPWTDENPAVNEGYKKLENVSNEDMQKYSAGALKDDVLRVIYNGYPYDNANLKAKYNLTDEQFRAVTQVALWYYTEGAYAKVNDSMTDQERWNNTFMIINRGVGAFDNAFWQGAADATKANMYKCMADLTGATVKYSQGTGYNVSSIFYRGNTNSLQQPAGNLTVDLFVHPTDDDNIDEMEKIQNLLSIGIVNPEGSVTGGLEEVDEVSFRNGYEGAAGNLIITKTIEGDVTEEEAEGAITFTVTGPNDFEETYTLKDFDNEDGKYTLTLEDVVIGEYTVEETTKDVDGKNVTVTYTINSGDETEGDSAKAEVTEGETTTVDFNNAYTNDKGNLVITKTLEGEVTDEEAKAAIEFKVTAPDGTSTVYTLNDFKFNNGEYVLELNNVVIGNYTVEETKQDINGKTVTVTYTLNNGETRNGTTVVAPVIKGETAEVDFRNAYANETGKLVITKTIEGDVTEEEAEGAITFTVTGPDDFEETYTLKDFENEDGKYTLTLEDVVIGEYTVEETTKDVDGKNVTVTYKINSGEETEGDSAKTEVTEGETTTVDFNNSYENKKGKLVITKTIEGDVTEEEAEGAITFTVTGPDGNSTTYTLDKFTKGEDGKYTLTLEDVVTGEYTVEETTKDVDGKNVTVTYTINSGAETEGDSAKTEVTEGETTTVDFNNSYENKKGKLVITKTIEGDVTEEEAEGAITFTVTGPDGNSTTYTLDKFTKGEDGKYTLTLEDVVIGEYTVEETTKDVDGKNVTVTYTINSGEETEGDSAKTEVTEGETTTVDFNNEYTNDKGNLVITKTLVGEVTDEEAKNAIEFKVTAPDGTSTVYTLNDFKFDNGEYVLELNNVVIGNYTVEETKQDINGKTVTVTYTLNNGETRNGTTVVAPVIKGETAEVDFRNAYANETGKLVITKTIEGDVTEEEAEGAITFTVTGPDDFEETYTLKDFDNEDGKYTLTLEDVVIGEYTVEETTKDVDGKNVTVTYKINSGEETEGDSAKTEVTEGETTTVDFNNSYENKKGKLVITKTIEGDVTEEEAEGAITFTVTGPDDFEETYTLKDFENEDGKYTLTLEDVVTGEYTVEETTKDVDGKNVTVTYTINSGAETEGDSAKTEVTEGETTTVDFNNSYENKKGKLVITKTIEGDVTEEEAEGAITFTVTGPDDFEETYTLKDFENEDGKYTLTLEDVVTGEYTVEETTKDVDGKNVTVTYKINSGAETEGDSAKTEVTEGETTTVDFNNSYENKKGKLVITKTIEGDVTEEEAEGAITFTVTGPDDFEETYTLKDFDNEDGKYTLTLEDVVIGEYTVEETTKDVDGKNVTVTYTINSGEETEGDSAKTEVTEGETTTVDFNNSYENKKGKLVITKTIEGDVTEEEAEGAITFTVTGPDDFEETYTLKDFENEDGKYTLTLEDVVTGEYTVEETTKDVDGKNVTVTYTINSGAETEGDSAKTEVTEGETTTVDFNNSYENKKGKLVITKTIEGDVTEEEAEGAITFTVTGPNNFEETYTLKDFENEDGKYTLTLEDVVIGEYTVEETTKDVDGKNVTVTYTINSGAETEGDSAKTEVTEGETTTVDFNNSYENKKGKLVITKTIEGDVTEEEAEGAITFTVTGPDDFEETYTLKDFDNEDGKYTLTLEDVVIGEYTVEETTKDVDGKNVTVTYKINSGEETEGDSAKTEVTEGETTTVDFNNSYENKKGMLVITKTIEGDVTEEEAEGAITFTVTGPDGNSTTYTLDKFTKGEDGKYTLTLEDVVIGEYTVEETTKDVDGKNVTVTYKINSGEETEGDSAKTEVTEGETTTVDFNNSYENKKGKLVITKTIEGDVTEEEAEGAITFTVTGPDGNSTTYTLDKFTKGEDGKYTLTLEDVVTGEYTVEETTKDVDGKNVTVTYKINSGEETEGDSAKTEVTEGETTTVDFNNSYENKKGKLVITKTIEGDVTEEEAEGAITFTVTGPDGNSTTYTLDKFTKGEDGKYTLTLEDVVTGEYTVEETTKDVDGKNVTVTYKINSGEETEGDSAKTEVTEGETTTVDFNNSYENKKGKLVITKTIEGDVTEEEAEGAITFTVTGPNNFEETYTLKDFENEDGKYTLTLEDVVIGEYTVEETTKDVDGKNVTVTYTINSGAETEGDSAKTEVTEGETTTVDFNNSYENKKGKLVITKTIEGDVTEEEAEGAITFTVTGPDDFEETYTLKDFDNEDGKYTLTLEDVVIGEYTVEETTKDVDGKNVTVTYKINSGEETEGDSAKTEVTEGETTTVDFNNSYENKKGKLVITKTIEGDVTEEEAEGAITFTVTGPDGTSTTYTLDKFTKGEDGKYTLTLEDVVIGEYTVEETTKDVDGKNVTVTYTINSGAETEGDSAKTEVTEGETTTVDFNNSYENKKGKLVITKTIEGDVTEEEAEGAITFTVTGPDDFEETYTLKDFENEDGKYTLTLEDVVIGEYTVEETTKDVDGKNVTVTYKINSGEETEGDSAKTEVTEGETTTVDFNNSYENKKGKLVITKTIEGDVTEEEAEGAITFTVTGPDGNSTTYTLDKFTKGEDGKYTLTLEDVVIGEYTVEETTKDVDGKNVTVTYKINSGEETEGDSAKTEVTEGETTTVDFNNSYENKKGKLVITKTIEGDVTEEEAEGAITFTVTGPDGNSTTYTLDKFTKGEDGKYTLTLEDVVIGEYTVEETTKDVDGKNVTVTYKINSGEETEGDSAKTEVTEGETTTVDFNNSYENEKPEIPNTGDHLVFSVASSLMFMSLSLLIAVIYAYKRFLNI